MSDKTKSRRLFEKALVTGAIRDAFKKLDPRIVARNPVMFVVEAGSAFTTALFFHALFTGRGEAPAGFILAVSVWLWFTVLFSNFAEALAEGRGKAQADTLRKTRKDVSARRLVSPGADQNLTEEVASALLKKGDVVAVLAGEIIPGDGEVIGGVASVDESAITGESAPVIRESVGPGKPRHPNRAFGADGLPDTHHHRRASFSHRHCGHGQIDRGQRAGNVGQGR